MSWARRLRRALLPALLCANAFAQAPEACPPVAQEPSAEQMRTGLRDARNHGFLWRIEKDGQRSYLYGTVHVARLEWAFPGPRLTQALKASDTIALELDALDPDIRQRMARAMTAPPTGAPLPDALRERLQRRAVAECLPAQALAGYAPEMQVASLMTLAGRRDGLDPGYGIDIVLAGWGHAAKKTVVSLETPELQLQAMRAGSDAETIEFVQSALDEMENDRARPMILRLANVWAEGDFGALAHYEDWCDCLNTAADRAVMKRLLDERNPALADAIAALHAKGAHVFAAVGSLHMVGPLGLPALMTQRGFRVEPVAMPH